MLKHFTYADLVVRCGEIVALNYLAEIEKAAKIRPQLGSTDPEARLAYALWLQDLTRENGDCLPQDLLPHGFSKEEIDKLWRRAHATAIVELKKHVSSNSLPILEREKCYV